MIYQRELNGIYKSNCGRFYDFRGKQLSVLERRLYSFLVNLTQSRNNRTVNEHLKFDEFENFVCISAFRRNRVLTGMENISISRFIFLHFHLNINRAAYARCFH